MVKEVRTHEEDRSGTVGRSVCIHAVSVRVDAYSSVVNAHRRRRSVMNYSWVFAPAVAILGQAHLRRSAIVTDFVERVGSARNTVHVVWAVLAGMGVQSGTDILVVGRSCGR